MTSFRPDGDEALRPVGETEFVPATARPSVWRTAPAWPRGIVGWADLTRPDDVGRTLDGHLEAGQDRFKGVRFNVVWHERHAHHAGREVPQHFLLDDGYRRGLARSSAAASPTTSGCSTHSSRSSPTPSMLFRADLRRQSSRWPGSRRTDARVAAPRSSTSGSATWPTSPAARTRCSRSAAWGCRSTGSASTDRPGPARPSSPRHGSPPSTPRSSFSDPTAACSRATSGRQAELQLRRALERVKLLSADYSPDERALLFSGTRAASTASTRHDACARTHEAHARRRDRAPRRRGDAALLRRGARAARRPAPARSTTRR